VNSFTQIFVSFSNIVTFEQIMQTVGVTECNIFNNIYLKTDFACNKSPSHTVQTSLTSPN